MDPRLAEIRKQQARRYHNLPEEEKPKIPSCSDCGKQIYDVAVCPKTGFLHNRHTDRLVAGLLVDASKRQFSGVELMAAIDAVRVRWQPSRISIVKADATALNIFQSFVLSMDWKMQRYGILYGRVVPSHSSAGEGGDATHAAAASGGKQHQVEVHCIYEPEQIGGESSFTLKDDPREATVDAIAQQLGLQRVGCVCTHAPRDEAAVTLSGHELLLCAKEQSKYGDHCVLITMGPNLESGQIHAQCWQASEQCVRYFQMGILSTATADPTDATTMTATTPPQTQHIVSQVPLEIAQDDQDRPGHKRVVIKESSKVIDTRWMTSYIAVESFQSPIVGNHFIRISRPACAPPTIANLKIFLEDARRAKLSFVEKIADFHVLIFLAEFVFDMTCDMPIILKAVLEKKNDDTKFYEEILRDRLSEGARRT